MAESTVVSRVTALVEPIASDLGVEIYDLEYAGGQLTVTLDTAPGSDGGITLDTLALATRLISRELDQVDPIPGHYTLEVTSPGLERHLRTPAHFRREVGKDVKVRLRNIVSGERRLSGSLVAADDRTFTLRIAGEERVVPYDQIDRARTVFVWGPAPKPGKKASKPGNKSPKGGRQAADPLSSSPTDPSPTDTEAPAS